MLLLVCVLAGSMAAATEARAQDPQTAVAPPLAQVEALPPPPPAVEIAAPTLVPPSTGMQLTREGDGVALQGPATAAIALPTSAATLFDRRFALDGTHDVILRATFVATSATARYGLVVGMLNRPGIVGGRIT